MKVTLKPSLIEENTYGLHCEIEGGDNEQMHENFAKCIALYRGLDQKIVVRRIDIDSANRSVNVVITCPYSYTEVKDGLNKHFTQHGFGIK